MLGDLDPLEAEGAHRLDQDHDAGDDRRRPVGVQAGDLDALGERGRGELREHPLDRRQGEDVAVDPLGVVGLEAQLDRGQRGRRAGDGDPRARPRAPVADARPRSARARRRRAPRARPRVGGSEAMWRSVWRTTPACSEAWKAISAPVPTISSVEPPPMSIDQGRHRSAAARAWRRGR